MGQAASMAWRKRMQRGRGYESLAAGKRVVSRDIITRECYNVCWLAFVVIVGEMKA